MIKKELIAPCGMNCAICIGYFGYTMSGDKRKIKCKGCIPSGKSCAFIKKLMKDELKYCYECKDFPCVQLEKLDKKYRKRFDMSMIDNLKYIKENGMDKFLKKQVEKYECPNCGDLISVHTKKCYNCDYSI